MGGGGAYEQNKKNFRATRQNISKKGIKANKTFDLELLPYYPVSLQFFYKNFGLSNAIQKERTYTLVGIVSWGLSQGIKQCTCGT